MKKKVIEDLKNDSFEGFIAIEKLKDDRSMVPQKPGVYFVLRLCETEPKFLEIGTGGFFKQKNPNVSIEKLKNK